MSIKQKHRELTDSEFEKQFEHCLLDSKDFSHEAHLRLAWIHVTKYGIDQGIENIQTQLKKYVKHIGEEKIFNTTLTVAAVMVVYHFMLKSKFNSFDVFIQKHSRLNTHFKLLIDSHYGLDIYKNDLAKATYLKPDLVAFD